ncbi:hypothetical protein LPJ66_009332 [Kickxella alabastrina]|uniref:Uncharacterized protein n=1 Tax=Kickxella alabastrina TaxID=61397 RepID=A0ACC1I7E3_9FUNG|nr:hypothetical protein LPJ66_009332 [Kickxella alabastrina]
MSTRRATHAGSWYSDNADELSGQLDSWLDIVPNPVSEIEPAGDKTPVPIQGARAIIGPHAGYSYSGSNAAFAYKCIDPTQIKRVFILGPSHHVFLNNRCALSKCKEYSTPLGNLRLDLETIENLKGHGNWQTMSRDVDEDEHSLEMHLPYIFKMFERQIDRVSLVPILVGSLRFDGEQYYGELLAPYLADPQNLFVISSDFCHWGSRFKYTYYQELSSDGQQPTGRATHLGKARGGGGGDRQLPGNTPIWKSIRKLDWDGMEVVARMDHAGFKRYLDDTDNTICGRHPISVLLAAVNKLYPHPLAEEALEGQRNGGGNEVDWPRLRFVKYDQSSKVVGPADSSVSYASAYLYLPSLNM